MLKEGERLQDRYLIAKHIGQGGMGTVYLATDERFHSTVAIKEALFAEEKFAKSFEREARLLNSLKHSALPKVTDQFVEDNAQYIVMEYIEGEDLFERLRKSGRPFPVEEVLGWTDQLLEALDYLHGQGIIHRDIKPQNLKVTKQGKIILLDFGLAKGNPTDANHQTAAQSIFGFSRNYASLEQMQGTGTDPRSDVYSLAATVYHLITAQVPADALTRIMKVLNENTDPLEPAGKFNSEISQELSDGLDLCLALKSGERPAGVAEMRTALFQDSHTAFVDSGNRQTNPGNEDLLTQQTQILSPVGSSGGSSTGSSGMQSNIKTEVLSSNTNPDSVETRLAPAETAEEKGKSGKLGLIAAVAAMVVIVGGVAAMTMYWPSATAEVTGTENTNSAPEENSNVLSVEPEETTMSEEGTFDAIESGNSNVSLPSSPKTVEKSEAPSTEKRVTNEPKPQPTVKVPPIAIPKPSVKVEVSTTTAKSPTPAAPKPTPNVKPTPIRRLPTRKEVEKMTPEERRKMRRRVEQERRRRGLPPRPRPRPPRP